MNVFAPTLSDTRLQLRLGVADTYLYIDGGALNRGTSETLDDLNAINPQTHTVYL